MLEDFTDQPKGIQMSLKFALEELRARDAKDMNEYLEELRQEATGAGTSTELGTSRPVNSNNARLCRRCHSEIRGKLHGEGKCEPCLSIDLCHQPKYHRVTKASLKVGSSSPILLSSQLFALKHPKIPFVSPFDKQQDLYERIDRLAEQDPSHYSKDPNEREKYSAAHQKALCEQFSKALNETGQKVLDNLAKHDKKDQNIPREQMWLFELQLKDFWLEVSSSISQFKLFILTSYHRRPRVQSLTVEMKSSWGKDPRREWKHGFVAGLRNTFKLQPLRGRGAKGSKLDSSQLS